MSATTTSPHSTRPGNSRCPGFLRKNVTVSTAGNGAQRFAGVAHQAARNIDGDDRQFPARSCGGQSVRGWPLQRAAEPCTENRIHHQFRPIERGRRKRLDGPAPLLRVVTCRASQMVARAKQGDTNGPAGFGKMPGGDEAVAAVVTRSAQNDDGPHRPAPPDLACDGAAGILHHIDGWHAGGNRQTIGLGHLANTEQRRLAIHHIYATFPIEADRSYT